MANTDKVRRLSVMDQLYGLLKEKIERNEWLPGDRLPSENELAKTYGVSRMSVRMALQKLVALELLEVKNGGGYFVKDFQFRKVVEHVSGMMLHNIDYEDFNQFRALIEVQSLELLRGKALRPRDLKTMSDCCQAMDAAARARDPEAFARADYEFHRQICLMSGNGMFVYSYELVGPLFLEYLSQHYDADKLVPPIRDAAPGVDYYADAVRYHEEIVQALRSGDIQRAKEIVACFTHAPQGGAL